MRHDIVRSLLTVVFCLGSLFADGKMYWRETIPPEIAYQRALIHFDQGIQTMILQSKMDLEVVEPGDMMGWVVPVPAVPELAALPGDHGYHLFHRVSRYTVPRMIDISSLLFFWGPILVSVVLLILGLVSRKPKFLFISLFVLLSSALLVPSFTTASLEGMRGVEILHTGSVGGYDVQVIRSDDPGDLIIWLQEYDFHFDEADTQMFQTYINQEWCFVVASIDPIKDLLSTRGRFEGLVSPLVMRFPVERPVYPMALTGSGGFETTVLLYLLSEMKMNSDHLTLRAAVLLPEDEESIFPNEVLEEVDPPGFFTGINLNLSYLSKFKDTLSPSQMKEDFVFTPATNQAVYRETIVEW